MTAEEILVKAADIVDRGWCRYHRSDEQGRHCLTGALDMAIDGETNTVFTHMRGPQAQAVMRAIARELGCRNTEWDRLETEIVAWNNDGAREQIEVSTMLRNAKRQL